MSSAGNFAATPTVYEAEEDGNLTISWDSQNQTDLSRTNMVCFSILNPQRVLYEMIDGVEILKSRHQQFIGRVECDRVPLREGRVRLHLSRLRAEDSGSYRCELEANYNEILKRWELVTSSKCAELRRTFWVIRSSDVCCWVVITDANFFHSKIYLECDL